MNESVKDRMMIAETAARFSISHAAREYGVTRKTVRKWKRRYEENGIEGLQDLSRAPHRIANKISSELENRIVDLKKNRPKWGGGAIKERFDLPCSIKTIYRVFHDRGLIDS